LLIVEKVPDYVRTNGLNDKRKYAPFTRQLVAGTVLFGRFTAKVDSIQQFCRQAACR
jgi:hypothetical protein